MASDRTAPNKETLRYASEVHNEPESRVPRLVLIYPLDHTYLKSTFAREKWMLKLCCMAPEQEHPLEARNGEKEGTMVPALGWYCLDQFGVVSGPIVRWAKRHEAGIKFISRRFGDLVEAFPKDDLNGFLKSAGSSIADISSREETATGIIGDRIFAPDVTRLSGLYSKDYRLLAGQELVVLERIFQQYQHCGSLSLRTVDGRRLWICDEHTASLKLQSRSKSDIASLLQKYLKTVESQVRKVRTPGDVELRDLDEIFVELRISNELRRPSSQTEREYLGLMDAELRRRRTALWEQSLGPPSPAVLRGQMVTPNSLLQEINRAIIVGAPGTGKSTMLKYLANRVLMEGKLLPLFVELKTLEKEDFSSARRSLTDLICERCLGHEVFESPNGLETFREYLTEKLTAGEASVFLDGLDEVSGEEFFNSLRQSIKEFLRNELYRGNNFYVSTRPYALLDRFAADEAVEMEIEPLNEDQIARFVERYYSDEVEAKKFLKELARRPEVRELASVPALLGFLIVLYRRSGQAPNDRLELYKEIVQHLVITWDKEKPAKRDFRTTDTRRLEFLRHLAFRGLLQKRWPPSLSLIFTSSQILKEAEEYCRSKNISNQADDLAEEVKATAVLRQVGTDSYAFTHLTIQEYLAATVLASHRDRTRFLELAFFNPVLSEMELLPMALGLTDGKELYDALEKLPESLDFKKLRIEARSFRYAVSEAMLSVLSNILTKMVTEDDVEFGYFEFVARSFRGAISPARERLAESVSKELQNPAEVYRSRAASILTFLDSAPSLAALNAALEDSESEVRIEAAAALAHGREDRGFEVLAAELQSPEVDVRQSVIHKLWNIPGERAKNLIATALHDENLHIRSLAYESLAGRMGDAAIPILTDGLSDDDSWVRRVVVEALADIGGDPVIDPLISGSQDLDFSVSEKAVLALGKIGGKKIVQHLRRLLNERSGQIIGPIAEALALAGDRESRPLMVQLLNDYIGRCSEIEGIDVFIGGWINHYVKVRLARALSLLGEERGREVLFESLSDGWSGQREYVIWALSHIDGDGLRPLLPDLLEKAADERGLMAVAEAFEELGEPNDANVIRSVLSIVNRSHGMFVDGGRTRAMNFLGRVGGPEVIEGLARAIRHDSMTQLSAIVALSNIRDALIVRPVLEGLGPSVNAVSQTAAEALARLEDSVLYEGLLKSFESDSRYARRKAAQSIAYYATDERAGNELSVLAINDSGGRVRSEANQALIHLTLKRQLIEWVQEDGNG